ncbi:MAG: prephenate dehydrogenase/arogenate dehydrogenase family protein [Opitutaceae bacterium]
MLDQLTILAPGLLGASVAMAARRFGAAQRIVAWARRPEVRVQLASAAWCDHVCSTPEDAARDASLVVICAPVETIPTLAATIRPHLRAAALVTDVGSVKGELCRRAGAGYATDAAGPLFVGSHPMAGSEKCGHEAGSAELFQGRACFVTPFDHTPPAAVETLVRFWNALGCEVVTMHPDRHDEIVAHVSHLPHLAAACLCSLLATKSTDWRNLAGPGLRDTTRVAAGDPKLWRGILTENRDEVLRALRTYQDELEALHAALANRNDLELLTLLERGKTWRDRLRVTS